MNKEAIRIMALDDESYMLQLHVQMLIKLGYGSVSGYESGLSALESIDRSGIQPEVVMLDLNMPGMDGLEFVRKLVERNYGGSLILVSGEDERMLQMAEKLVTAHHIAVLGHIKKPASLAGLAAMLDKHCQLPAAGARATRKVYGADELRAAIDNGELVNYYQPQVSVADGRLIGVETLARWRHPVDGMVLPDQFIALAEEHQLIDALTHAVMATALQQARTWRDAGLRLKVAVNVSMDNLSSVTFADFVANAASRAGVLPQDIVLEVTESRLMLDQRAPLEILTRLRLKRFQLSIDDFGTGHSSLTQLRDIPFDELKIDRSFVHGACSDPTVRAMYDASLGLGRQLGMAVVAEGVEDRADWDLLRSTGCDLAQGYLIARPMPAADLPGWIASWETRRQQLLPAAP